MSTNNSKDFIRNIELLARLLQEEQITKQQAADFYNVEEITISRALQYYRSLGIEAFGRKSGIIIQNRPKKEDLIALSSYYLSLKLNSDYFSNSIKTYSKIDPKFFSKIIIAAKAVNEEIIIRIEYQKLTDNITSVYYLKPYKLIESSNNWVLQAVKVGETTLKTFYLSRIKNISLTQKKFKKEFIETKTSDIK